MDPLTMSFEEFIRLVLDAVEAAKVEYMIGGSVGLFAWGEPRTTRDVDIAINLPVEQVYLLSQELNKRGMLVPWEIILDLLVQTEGDLPINAIHIDTGYKAELFLLRSEDTFRATALSRRRLVNLGAPVGQAYLQTPEDLIIYKLRYYQLSQQPKHARDIQSILVAMGNELDYTYLNQWITHFNLTSAWQVVKNWSQS